MFLVRPATLEDASTLLKLAKMVHFINLPADPEAQNSIPSLSGQAFRPSQHSRLATRDSVSSHA